MKKILLFAALALIVLACGGNSEKPSDKYRNAEVIVKDDGLGVGEIKTVSLNDPLDQEMVKRGLAIYEMKCSACHKLKGSRVVGPSFAGVTSRRTPPWIMNMITNVDVMLEKDPAAQKLLEECLTRMPNQNVSIGDARDILEFFFQNDLGNAK